MTSTIPDFTEAEQEMVAAQLVKRYGMPVALQLADSELQLGADPQELTPCPTLYWSERGAHFVVCKVAEHRYRCQFFYSEIEQYGTGRNEYDNLENCVITLLRVQSDHERQMANISSGTTAADIGDEDYHGPALI